MCLAASVGPTHQKTVAPTQLPSDPLSNVPSGAKLFLFDNFHSLGFPGSTSGKEPTCQCRKHKMQVPGNLNRSHGQRGHGVAKSRTSYRTGPHALFYQTMKVRVRAWHSLGESPSLADSDSWLLGDTEATVASGPALGVKVPPSTGVPTTGMCCACRIHPPRPAEPSCDLLSPLPHSCLQSPPCPPVWPPRMSQWVTDATALLVGQGLGWGLPTSPGPPGQLRCQH